MLQTINRLDPKNARQVLSLASARLLPPSLSFGDQTGADTAPKELRETVEKTVHELGERARAFRPKNEDEFRSYIWSELSKELSRVAFKDVDKNEVRQRLGAMGRLSPSLYQVTYSPKFENMESMYNISKKNVENAIANCDFVEHLSTSLEGKDGPKHASIFLQRPETKGQRFTIIVAADREGDRLIVNDVFRAFDDEVDISAISSPLKALEFFLNTFGQVVEVRLSNGKELARGKFIHNLALELPSGEAIETSFPDGSKTGFQLPEDADDRRVEISLTYSINNIAYAASLNRHGITSIPHAGSLAVKSRYVGSNKK